MGTRWAQIVVDKEHMAGKISEAEWQLAQDILYGEGLPSNEALTALVKILRCKPNGTEEYLSAEYGYISLDSDIRKREIIIQGLADAIDPNKYDIMPSGKKTLKKTRKITFSNKHPYIEKIRKARIAQAIFRLIKQDGFPAIDAIEKVADALGYQSDHKTIEKYYHLHRSSLESYYHDPVWFERSPLPTIQELTEEVRPANRRSK